MWPPDEQRFADRTTAGRELAADVAAYLANLPLTDETTAPMVLALPRGGVPVGYEIAKSINADFDVIVSCKIGLPWQPEFSVGAIAEDGPAVFDRNALACVGLNSSDLGPAVQRQRVELRRRQEHYRGQRPAPPITDRVVVIVDDGLATGMTSRAAVKAVKAANPAHLVFAAPVCAAEAVDWLNDEADAVLCVHSPREFHALGLWYREFPQLTDDDVVSTLAHAWSAIRPAIVLP
jgi:putative phosphoribosyl transferase